VPDDPHEPVVIDAQDLMGPGPVLLLRREMAIEEDLPLIEAHKSPDPPLSIRPVFLCGKVGVADGKCIEDLLQDVIKETGVHNVIVHQKNSSCIFCHWNISCLAGITKTLVSQISHGVYIVPPYIRWLKPKIV
jgi:hypothetical protein